MWSASSVECKCGGAAGWQFQKGAGKNTTDLFYVKIKALWEIRCILLYYLKNTPQSSPDSFLTSGCKYEIKPRL